MTSLKISGTSIGAYNNLLYGPGHRDQNLVFGTPRDIRSDEWLVNSQVIVEQAAAGFPRFNPNIGNGQDMSLVIDAPYKEWSVIFKPHNLAFFVMPLENAFAFRWWTMAYLLLVSCYWLVLTLLPGRRLIASLAALALFLSPFVQWWYAYGTLGSLYYSLFIGVVLIKILNSRTTKARLLWSGLFCYLAIALGLVLYPPFQIACAIAIGALFLGCLIESYDNKKRRQIIVSLGYILAASAVAGCALLIYLKTRPAAVNAMTHTVYPGKRESVSGGLDPLHMFASPLSPLLQADHRGAHYFTNQSEASGFLYLYPFLFLASGFALFRGWRLKKPIDWPLLTVNAALLVLTTRVFVPGFDPLYKLLLLNYVPNKRLMVGVGLLSLLQIVLLCRHWIRHKHSPNMGMAWLSSLAAFAVFYYTGDYVRRTYPIFLSSRQLVFAAAAVMAVMVYLLCVHRFTAALAVMVAFSLLCVYKVNPLYRGLGEPMHGRVAAAIRGHADGGSWIVTDQLIDENFPADLSQRSLSGVQLYPQLDLWYDADPKHIFEFSYNRYAHVYFHLEDRPNIKFMNSLDSFGVFINPCNDFLKDHGVKHVLAVNPSSSSCLELKDSIPYPSLTFYIYDLK